MKKQIYIKNHFEKTVFTLSLLFILLTLATDAQAVCTTKIWCGQDGRCEARQQCDGKDKYGYSNGAGYQFNNYKYDSKPTRSQQTQCVPMMQNGVWTTVCY